MLSNTTTTAAGRPCGKLTTNIKYIAVVNGLSVLAQTITSGNLFCDVVECGRGDQAGMGGGGVVK